MTPKHRNILLCLALVVVTAAVYFPGMSGRFLFDDYPNIVSNSRVHATSLTWDSLTQAATAYEHGAYGRPLAMMSFAVNHAVGGTDPTGYKLTNLAIHLVNTLLVFLLVSTLLSLANARDTWSRWTAATVALLWAVHPIQVSSVLYVVQRMETLSATFILAALLAYTHGRRTQIEGRKAWPWLAACIPLTFLGLMSKETALLFPAYTLALELTLLGFGAQSLRTTRIWRWSYTAASTIGVILFAFVILPPYLDPAIFEFRGFTLGDRLLTQFRVLVMYLGQMLLPLPSSLTFYYDAYPASRGLLQPASTLLCGLLLACIAAAGLAMRRRAPLFSLGILWFFAAHLLTSNVFPLELAFEHRNYFALLGILLALTDIVHRIRLRDGPALKYVTVGAIVIGFGFLATVRTATWGNPLHLAMDQAHKTPMSARASSDLAEQYMVMADGNPDSPFHGMAVAEFERGSRLPGASPLPEQGLILMAGSMGLPAKDIWWARLIEKLRTRPLGPQEHGAVAGLLKHRDDGIELDDRRLAEAYTVLVDRSELPSFVYAQFAGHALARLKDDELASRLFVLAVENETHDREYALRLFATLLAEGHVSQAQAVEARAQELGLMPQTLPSTSDG